MLVLSGIFISAFFASLAHCFGMCSPLILAISQIKKNFSIPNQIIYHLGRLISYEIIGLLFCIFGAFISDFRIFDAVFMIIIGIALILYAILFSFYPKLLSFIEPNISKTNIFKKAFNVLLFSTSKSSYFGLGLLNGLLPCGLVYFYALMSLNNSLNPMQSHIFQNIFIDSILIMFVFWVATLCPMLIFGAFSNFLNQYKKNFIYIASLIMFMFGVYSIFKGLKFFLPSLSYT